ncbi:unnamed protein product [Dovyalis caffra]|uniref:Uncharacterized protein n=1 Tax=Dovyalis caffra TaxID=77055 RepID=A0AAV1ST84_9ROSI|nr:unnamed protein product [Dovyalis caffra]
MAQFSLTIDIGFLRELQDLPQTHKGYLLGGLVWFAVPFSLATSLGLGALALDLPITDSKASHGLVPPATAIAFMGKGGSILLTMLFIYINPDASGKEILTVSRGVDSLMLLWRKANAIGANLGAIIGCVLGIITWLVVTKTEYGRINLDTTGRNAPMLAGEFSLGYFTFWTVIAIAWGTIGSTGIIALPLMESWDTNQSVCLGMLTNDRLMEKEEEMNIKLHTIILAVPEAQRIYLLEKEKARKKEESEHLTLPSIFAHAFAFNLIHFTGLPQEKF